MSSSAGTLRVAFDAAARDGGSYNLFDNFERGALAVA
jgi:hypothetical protein